MFATKQGERRIRGTGIYPAASLLNHECLPNVARVDNFDAAGVVPPHNTVVRTMSFCCSAILQGTFTALHVRANVCVWLQIAFRALHDLPAGEEFTQSYFPLHISYSARQARCRSQYGFECTCPRCKAGALPSRALLLNCMTELSTSQSNISDTLCDAFVCIIHRRRALGRAKRMALRIFPWMWKLAVQRQGRLRA